MKKKLTNLIKEISLRDISNDLASLCSVDIPTDTVVYLGRKIIGEKAKKFDLSPPKLNGKGLIVNPVLFAYLRDAVIPYCSRQGFPAEIERNYRSRGDEWGMLLDASHNANKYGFLADFGCWEEEINNKLIQTVSPKSVVNLAFLLCTVGQRLSNILKLIKDD